MKLISLAELVWGALALADCVVVCFAVAKHDMAFVAGATIGTLGWFYATQYGLAAKARKERAHP